MFSKRGAERSFSLLACVKDVLRSVMSQGRLSSLGVIGAAVDMARKINFDHVIDKFATEKSRKAFI